MPPIPLTDIVYGDPEAFVRLSVSHLCMRLFIVVLAFRQESSHTVNTKRTPVRTTLKD